MIRKIIHIDEEKCNGCGACASACQEGAIAMVDGKARLMRDDYCDGLGNCLPACPTGAITFVEREAAAYDEAAVEKHLKERAEKALEHAKPVHGGCPGMMARAIRRENAPAPAATQEMPSQLSQWPVQIRLVPVNAPYFDGAKLLIPPIVRPMPTPISIRSSFGDISCWWAAPSWTMWTMRTS